MVVDPLSDFVVRIKNGYMAKLVFVEMPTSRMKEAVAAVLEKSGYIGETKTKDGLLTINLKYGAKDQPALTDIRRVSKPGLRVYTGVKHMPWVLGGRGISVLSTPKGVMNNHQAKKLKLGGEIIAKVW